MAQTIKLKRSSVSGNTPSTSDLELGEVAINTYDGKMFIKKNDGSDSIVEIGGSSGTVTDAFKTIAVSGQTSVVADSATDTLTFVAGTNMSITTNASGDAITFASTGSSGSATFLGLSDTPANFTGAAGKFLKVNSGGNSIEFDTLNFDDLGTTPTTLAGYGITDSLQLGTSSTTALAGNTSIPSALTDLSISDGSNGQVLQTDGSGNFSFVNQTGGNSFGTIAVSGQSDVVADQGSDTLTLVAGNNITLSTNASGDSVTITSTASGSGPTAADAILEEYQFTATSGQTTFTGSDDNSQTLSYTANAIQVFLNGIFLDPSVDYTATNGTSIVLSETVDANDYLQIIAYKKKISDGQTTVNTFTGNGSTTAFTLSLNPGDENNTRVFVDGVYQSKSNYSVSGTTLTFTTAPSNGTAIEVEVGNRIVTLDTLSNLDLPDNVKLRLGTSQDLEIFHDGNNSRITDTGTGDLIIKGGNDILFQDAVGNTLANMNQSNSVELYFGGNKKFETTSAGVDVTGIIKASGNGKLQIADDVEGSTFEFNVGGTGALEIYDGTTERFRIDSSGNVGIGTTTPSSFSGDGNNLVVGTTSGNNGISVISATDGTSNIYFGDTTTTGGGSRRGQIVYDHNTDSMRFATAVTERMRIDSAGRVGIGTTNTTFVNGGGLKIADEAAARLILTDSTNGVGSEDGLQFTQSGTNAYFNLHENGFMAFHTNNTERMRIDSSGNVGIGATSLSNKLTIDAALSHLRLQGASNANKNVSIQYNESGDYGQINCDESGVNQQDLWITGLNLKFGRNINTERMRLDASGNLLVGKTSTSTSVVGSAIYNYGTIGATRDGSHALDLGRNTSDGDIAVFRKDNSIVGSIGNNTDFYIASQDGTGLRFTTTQVLPCSESGAIQNGSRDLGSSSGRFKDLHLAGSVITGGNTANNFGSIDFKADSVRARIVGGYASGGGGYLKFHTDSTGGSDLERARIDNSGNLLVGTTDTTLYSNASGDGIYLGAEARIDVARENAVCMTLNRMVSNGNAIEFRRAGTVVGSVSVSGTNATFNTSSDQRLKDNIVDAPSASDDIDAIQVRSFDWKADGSHQKYGMVAQELQTVAPEAVTGDANSDDMMGVDYSKLVPMMMKEIQSLRARVAELEGE